MARKPIWAREDTITAIHHRQIIEHGGLPGLRDENLLASALAHPLNLYEYQRPRPSLAMLAAAYAYGIARNHPFSDGNKRTALITCEYFLNLNKAALIASPTERYNTIIKLAAGKLTESRLAAWIADHLADD